MDELWLNILLSASLATSFGALVPVIKNFFSARREAQEAKLRSRGADALHVAAVEGQWSAELEAKVLSEVFKGGHQDVQRWTVSDWNRLAEKFVPKNTRDRPFTDSGPE